MSDASLTEETPETDATLVLDEVQPVTPREAESTLPACEKCGLTTDAAACPRCGWYPSLGIHVEIDEAYEAYTQAATPPNAEGEQEAAAKKPEWRKHLDVWNGLIPGWGWLMIFTTLGVVGAAIAARVATLSNPVVQTYCGVGGLLGGLALLVLAHITGFIFCSSDDADFGVFDLIIKPLKTWKHLASELPYRLWLVNSANAGLTTALAAALIVGGVPYNRLLDWGFKAPPKQNLLGAIAQQAAKAKGDGSDSLEGAVGDFAGQAGDIEGDGKPSQAKPAELPPKPLDCLILGYQADQAGHLKAFLLASDAGGKLVYVGRVTPELDADEESELLAKFEKSTSTRPLIKTPESGVWLRPKFTCRATFTEWPRGQRPKNLEWGEMLDEVKLPW